MRLTSFLPVLLPAFVACATEAPAVELTNGATKSDDAGFSAMFRAGDRLDFALACEHDAGCDIGLQVLGSEGLGQPYSITLERPDGFSRTEYPPADESVHSVAFFGQDPGHYGVSLVNESSHDFQITLRASWYETAEIAPGPIGAACDDDTQCAQGHSCLSGFCTASCEVFGQSRCEDVDPGSTCLAVDEDGSAFCFKTCDLEAPDCGGDHLECNDFAVDIDADGQLDGLCTPAPGSE